MRWLNAKMTFLIGGRTASARVEKLTCDNVFAGSSELAAFYRRGNHPGSARLAPHERQIEQGQLVLSAAQDGEPRWD